MGCYVNINTCYIVTIASAQIIFSDILNIEYVMRGYVLAMS